MRESVSAFVAASAFAYLSSKRAFFLTEES